MTPCRLTQTNRRQTGQIFENIMPPTQGNIPLQHVHRLLSTQGMGLRKLRHYAIARTPVRVTSSMVLQREWFLPVCQSSLSVGHCRRKNR